MKKTLLSTLIFLSATSFFNGCANTTPNADEKLAKETPSVYNIMGIKEPKQNQPIFVVRDNENTNYHFRTPNRQVSDNIEIVSYGSYRPVMAVNTKELINHIEWNAKSFLGTKYVWGATGPTQFDCSGFTQWVYRDAGIQLPRVSRDQAKVGRYISYENLQKGDMVFFDTKKHKKGIVTHVGIYLGNGNFIHASSAAHKVVVYNFNQKPYYKKRFLWGRRVVQNNAMYASN